MVFQEKPQEPATGGSSPTQGNTAPARRRPLLLQPVSLELATVGSMARRGVLSTVGAMVQGAARFMTNVLIGRIGGPIIHGFGRECDLTLALRLALSVPMSFTLSKRPPSLSLTLRSAMAK